MVSVPCQRRRELVVLQARGAVGVPHQLDLGVGRDRLAGRPQARPAGGELRPHRRAVGPRRPVLRGVLRRLRHGAGRSKVARRHRAAPPRGAAKSPAAGGNPSNSRLRGRGALVIDQTPPRGPASPSSSPVARNPELAPVALGPRSGRSLKGTGPPGTPTPTTSPAGVLGRPQMDDNLLEWLVRSRPPALPRRCAAVVNRCTPSDWTRPVGVGLDGRSPRLRSSHPRSPRCRIRLPLQQPKPYAQAPDRRKPQA